LSYGQFADAIATAAQRLHDQGVAHGETVALAMAADAGYLVLLNALFRLGAVACPLNPRWPEKALGEALAGVNCARIMLGRDAQEFVVPASAGPDRLKAALRTGRAEVRIDEQQPATIVFTSGSTGAPKGALHSYGNHYHNAALSNGNIRVQPGDRWLLSLPLYHVAGLGILFRCALAGAAVAIPEPGESLAEAIAALGATHVSLVPTQLYRLLDSPEGLAAARGLKAILIGGGPAPPPLLERAASERLPLCVSYGLTEMASQAATTRPGDPVEALLTAGEPLEPDTVAVAEDGEILVRGRALFLGYRRGDVVDRPLTGDGRFATGDLGRFDDAGRLVVVGRKDNRFVCGGENIQPEEVERLLCAEEGIREAVVAPVDDAEYGQVPVAFVRTRAGTALDEAALLACLARELPRFKIPRRIFEWPANVEPAGIKAPRGAFAALAGDRMRQGG